MRPLLLILLLATPIAAEEPLTNSDVLRMIKDGVPASVVAAKIRASTTRFDLTTEAIVSLTKAGVPETVLTAMLAQATPPTTAGQEPKATGLDMLKWKQECEKTGWPDYICRPGEPSITFRKVGFYKTDAAPSALADLTITHGRLSATVISRQILDMPWTDVEDFCAEFGPWRNMFYLQTTNGELRFDLGGGEKELSRFLRKILLSIKPEKCEN